MSAHASTVFVVDDDASFLRSIARWLRGHGYTVECYTSAADFLERRPVNRPGCVVTDLQMPGMNGISMQKALKQSDHPLPVVFLTGQGDIQTSVQAMRDGAEDFLVKTIAKDALLSAISRALARDLCERSARLRLRSLLIRFDQLTSREKEVLAHVLCGQLNKQTAASLNVDERTVKRHRTNMMRKLEIKSAVELARLCAELGGDHQMFSTSDVFA